MSVKIIQVETLKRSDEELIEEITQDIGVLNCISQNKDKPQYKQLFATNLKILKSDIDFFADNINYLNDFLKDTKFINVIGGIANSTISFSLMVKATVDMNNFDDCPIEKTIGFRKIYELTHNYVFEKRARLEREKQEKLRIQKLEQIAEGQRNIEQGLANIIIEEDVPQVNQVNQVNEINQVIQVNEVNPVNQVNNVEKVQEDLDNEIINESESDSDIESDSDSESDSESESGDFVDSDEVIQDEKSYEKIAENPFLRKQQKDVVKKLLDNKFPSGIVSQIMGAGKSFSILLAINSHYKYQLEEKKPINNIYLITTDRTEILTSWFFKKQIDSEGNEQFVPNSERFKFWKDNKIINMDDFEFYENVINKSSVIKSINKSTKPVIYVVNNAFLKASDKYKEIDGKKLKLVLLDECHCVSGKETYTMLQYLRYNFGSSIIGFSATPLRPTKKAEQYLLDIFGSDMNKENNRLNIISEYNLMDALIDDIVLPFHQTIIYPKIKDGKIVGKSKNPNDITVAKIIETYVLKNFMLPYKKCVVWVRSINKICDGGSYYEAIKNIVGDKLKIRRSYSKSTKNGSAIDEINEFTQDERDSILLCVNRVKEGSDIPNVDCAIFLDAVKNRSILVSLQSIGRVMRPDADKKKKYAYAFESVKVDENKTVEMLSVEKVLSYYKKILNLATLKDQEAHLDKILTLYNNTEINEDTKEVKIKIADNKDIILKLETEDLNWGDFKKFLKKQFAEKIKMTRDKIFKEIINKVKRFKVFSDPECDFWDEYDKLDHVNLGIPSDFKTEFADVWKNTTWYKELGLNNFYTFNEFNLAIKSNLKLIKYCDNWNKLSIEKIIFMRQIDDKIPPNPKEYYKLEKY